VSGKSESGASVGLGRKEAEMAAFLQSYALNHKSMSLKPRGLSNRSNWCFVNAIMQALVACPPFYNLASFFSFGPPQVPRCRRCGG
jgi:ubiquitin carboxyl-terminal hydrolase 10